MSAADLLFKKMINLNRGIFLPQNTSSLIHPERSLSDYLQKLLSIQDTLLQLAKQNIETADNAHMQSTSGTFTSFPIGSYVLLDYPNAPPTRLHTKKRGPFLVVFFRDNDYTLRNLVTNKEFTVNITRLSQFNYDPQHTDPRVVANRDQTAFDV